MLRLMRQRVSTWQESRDFEAAREAASELTMMFAELDGWLSRGGFPPDAWRYGNEVAHELHRREGGKGDE